MMWKVRFFLHWYIYILLQYYESSHHAFTDRTAVATYEGADGLAYLVIFLNRVLCKGTEDNVNDCPRDDISECISWGAGVICPDGN